jgi:hypothetical protein
MGGTVGPYAVRHVVVAGAPAPAGAAAAAPTSAYTAQSECVAAYAAEMAAVGSTGE